MEELPNPVPATDLAQRILACLRADSADVISLTGGEPLLQAEFIRDFLATYPLPAPILLETSGVLPKRLARVIDRVQIVSMDLKLPSNSGERAFWKEHDDFLRHLVGSGKEIYLKILVDQGTTLAEILTAGSLVAGHDAAIPVFLQPITNREGRTDLCAERLEEFFFALRRSLSHVRVVPQTHKYLQIP